jgi:hypothetical protein
MVMVIGNDHTAPRWRQAARPPLNLRPLRMQQPSGTKLRISSSLVFFVVKSRVKNW